MFTTGSKFLIGSAVLATLTAIVYGLTEDGVRGTVGLVSVAVVLSFLAGLNLVLRDSNVFVDDAAPVDTTAAAQRPVGASIWPLLFAFGGVTIVVGLVSYQPITLIGIVAVVAAGAEWMLQAWAEDASSERTYNAGVRNRLSNPLEYPVFAAVGAGVIVYAFSRVMLWLSKTNTVIAFSVLAALVLAIGFTFAASSKVKAGAIGGTVVVGAIAIVAAGSAAGLDGQREIPVFETTSIWMHEAIEHPEEYAEGAEQGKHPAGFICESPEEFPEADEDVSQTVALKSNVYTVVLSENGTLELDVPGPLEEGAQGMVIPRSNPTNVLFRNESSDDRRLSVDLGDEDGDEDGDVDADDAGHPIQQCTTLIEDGGAQILTLTVGQPSFAAAGVNNGIEGEGDYWFFVPGVPEAKLRLIVP